MNQLAHEPINEMFDATLLFKVLYKLMDGYMRGHKDWKDYDRKVIENCKNSSKKVVLIPETWRSIKTYEGLLENENYEKYSVELPTINGLAHWQDNSVRIIYVLKS